MVAFYSVFIVPVMYRFIATGLLSLGCVFSAFASGEVTLIHGDIAAGKQKAAVCQACHAVTAEQVVAPNFPVIAGQYQSYLISSLKAYRSQERNNAIMYPMASALTDQDIENVSAFYASLHFPPRPVADGVRQSDTYLKGKRVFLGGNTANNLPACSSCHGPSGLGSPIAHFPKLQGQSAMYVAQKLKEYRAGTAGSDQYATMMSQAVANITDEEIQAVADFVQNIPQ